MVDAEGVSTRARKPLPKLKHNFRALLIGHVVPFLTEMMFRHVELDARWNGSKRISTARATCPFSPLAGRPGYIRMPRRDESKQEAQERLSSPAHSPLVLRDRSSRGKERTAGEGGTGIFPL